MVSRFGETPFESIECSFLLELLLSGKHGMKNLVAVVHRSTRATYHVHSIIKCCLHDVQHHGTRILNCQH